MDNQRKARKPFLQDSTSSTLANFMVPAGTERLVVTRLDYEVKYNGIAQASPRQFDHTSLEQELADRHNFLFAKMTMPVLFLQGKNDPGQHPEKYENTPDFVAHGRVQFIDGNHFFQLGAPDAATAAMRAFLSEPLAWTK